MIETIQSGSLIVCTLLFQLTLAGVLVAMFLLSFDSVESDCNCEGPVVNNCCPTGFNGECCEYPILQRSKKPLDEVSPLAQKLKKEAHGKKAIY